MNYGYVEPSRLSCPNCPDKLMDLILAEDEDTGEYRQIHLCELCGRIDPDTVWRIDIAQTHRDVEAALALSTEDAEKILAGLGVGARERMEARLA